MRTVKPDAPRLKVPASAYEVKPVAGMTEAFIASCNHCRHQTSKAGSQRRTIGPITDHIRQKHPDVCEG